MVEFDSLKMLKTKNISPPATTGYHRVLTTISSRSAPSIWATISITTEETAQLTATWRGGTTVAISPT